MGFGNESDDDLIVIENGPKKNVLPTDKEIDEKLRIWVDDEVQKGNDPKDMKLMVLLKRMQKCYEGVEIKGNTDMIRKVCKSLRKYQRFYESQPEKDKQPVQYYKGNISTVDIQTLDPKEWLNDQIMNRYLELIGQAKDMFVPISSFFLESLLKNRPEKFRESLVDKIGFIPCNRSHHWSLIVIFHKQKTILLFDSMGNFTDLDTLLLLNKLRSHLNNLYNMKFKVMIHKKVKSQSNSDDCGVFVLMWARSMMEGCEHLNDLGRSESHMTCVRNFFKEEIMNAKLSVWNNLLLKLKLPSNH